MCIRDRDTPETLEATLQQFEAEMRRWGSRGVRSYAYVNGRYKADCLNTVKKHFDLGLTVEKGIDVYKRQGYSSKALLPQKSQEIAVLSVPSSNSFDGIICR